MSITQQSDEERVYKMLLPHNHAVHTAYKIRHKCALLFNPDIQFTDVNSFCHNILFVFILLSQ